MAMTPQLRLALLQALKDPAAGNEFNTLIDALIDLTAPETTLIDGVTAGTFAVGKAMTLDSNGDATAVDGMDIALGTTTGTKIGTAAAQKLGFFGADPVVQADALTAEDGGTVDGTYGAEEQGVLSNAVTRIGEIETILVNLGLAAAAS